MTTPEQILQLHHTFWAAHDAGDMETIFRYLHPQGTLFHTNSNLLIPLSHEATQAAYDAGYGGQVMSHHVEVAVFGNCAAVTGYLNGTIQWAGGGSIQGTWRYSAMWVNENEQWRVVHTHISPLAPSHTTF